jgi:hypothetical protein
MESSANINSPSINENSFFNSTSDANISGNSNDTDFFSKFKNINATTIIIVIFILSFLGINIFVYLAKGTEEVTSVFSPFFKLATDIFAYLSSIIVGVTAAGTRNIVDETVSVIGDGLDKIENTADKISENTNPSQIKQKKNNDLSSTSPSSLKGDNINDNNIPQSSNRPLDKIFQATQPEEYEPDDSGSNIQSGTNKSGWCYIGEDRGFRSCIEVNKSDTCMSEDIFPSNEVCVNPTLRY